MSRTRYARGFTGWPWRKPRPNPDADILLDPEWIPLRRGGEWNRIVREKTRGKAGVYMVREHSNPRTILYVGESHTPSKAHPLRFWKTLTRHFQDPTGRFEYTHSSNGKPSEWVYRGNRDLDVAIFVTPPSKAREYEGRAILEYEPLHVRGPEDDTFDPFELDEAA